MLAPRSPPGLGRRFAARSSIALAALAAGLLAAELLVRFGGLTPLPRPVYRGQVLRDSADPELGFENTPGAVMLALYRNRAGAVEREVEHRINPEGWRGPEGLAIPDGAVCIACVGDSQVFGMGVAEEETFPRSLERTLAQFVPGLDVRALNFGAFGYLVAEKARLVETRLAPFRPAIVLFQLYIWESPEGQRLLIALQKRDPLMRWLRLGGPGPVSWLRQRSRFVDFTASALVRRAWLANWTEAHSSAVGGRGPYFEETGAQILRARAAATALGAGFAVVLYPMLFEAHGELVSAPLGRVLDDFARQHGLHFLDLHAAFEGRELVPLRIHPDDYHLSGAGHDLAARATADFLLRAGLIDSAARRLPPSMRAASR